MARTINKIRAEGTAWRIAQEYCLEAPGPTPVEDIAMDNGVVCLEGNLTGCLARLVRKGARGIIRTKSEIREIGRKRFAIAHELGHWFLHKDESQYFICSAEQMLDYKGSPIEVEANIFASELLMPTFLFRPLATDVEPALQTVSNLAQTFATSLTATGMKFVDLSRHECVLILSVGGKVAWSKQKAARSGFRIQKGMDLHQDALARHVIKPFGKLGPEPVAPEVWISETWYDRTISVTEESWTLDGYKSVLTLLVVNETEETDEDDMVRHFQRR